MHLTGAHRRVLDLVKAGYLRLSHCGPALHTLVVDLGMTEPPMVTTNGDFIEITEAGAEYAKPKLITIWMGQNVDDMTREQAIEALKLCARLLDDANKRNLEVHEFHRELRERRRTG